MASNEKKVSYDPDVIKKIVSKALSEIPGVLGLHGGIVSAVKDAFSSEKDHDFDYDKGISVKIKDEYVNLDVQIITEFGKNIPEIVNEITEKIEVAVKNTTGLEIKKFDIEVVDTMTREDYEKEYGKVERAKEEVKENIEEAKEDMQDGIDDIKEKLDE